MLHWAIIAVESDGFTSLQQIQKMDGKYMECLGVCLVCYIKLHLFKHEE